MPGIEWIATCNNAGFIRSMNEMASQVHQTKAIIEAMGDDASKTIGRLNSGSDAVIGKLKQIGALAGVAFSFSQAKSFIQKMADTRAYFQDIESSMKVFLGSQEKAADFTKKLKDYAYYNMFEFSELAAASKQMIAYGHNVDTIIPRLDQLSNVARGTNAPLMEMVGAYNRAKNLGGLGARDLQSWAAKGLVIKDILKEMGETVDGNTVSFEQLNKVLDKVTGEGGMFHNLMGEQMNNISAEKGQLEDVLDSMYNKIGEKYQDAIVKYYKMASETVESFTENFDSFFDVGADTADFLLEHYQEIGKALMSLVGAYGAYKAAFVATMAVENAYKSVKQKTIYNTEVKLLEEEIKKLKESLPAKEAVKNADLAEAVAKKQLTEKQAEVIAARRAEFEQLQIDKELLGVNDSISKEKLKLLDLDLQEKVANEELTRSQAETIQKRREELIAIENQVAARRKLQMKSLNKQYEETEKEQTRTEDSIGFYTERNRKNRNEIKDINDDIEKLETIGGKEEEINRLIERRTELESTIASNEASIIKNREYLNNLEQQRQDILQKQHDTILQFGSDEEKLDLLKQDRIALQEEKAAYDSLIEKKEAELVIIQQQHEQSKERLRLLQEELTKQQQLNMEKSKRGEAPDDLSSLAESVDVALLQEEADAKKENAVATQIKEAAEKSEALQGRINNVVEKENTIATGGNTAAKGANTAATNAATVSQRIHNLAVKAGSNITKFFSTAVTQATTALKGMGKAIMANPLGLILSAIMLVLPYIMDFIDAEKNAKNAQEALNDAIEEHNKVLQEEENKDRESIKTIKDKNASLYDQYKAYKDLTKARGVFAQYTQEELKNMSQEQIDSLFSMDKAEKEKKMLQDRIQMYKEYQQWVGTGWRANRAFFVSGEEDKLKELQEKYNMGTEATDAFNSQSSFVPNAQMAESWVEEAQNLLRERLEGEARAGVANGLKSGFGDPEVQGKAASLISDFSQEIKNISQEELSKKGDEIATRYKESLSPAVEEAKQKVQELNSEITKASGDKKVKLEAQLETAEQTYEFLNSVMSFFEAGSTNKTLTIEIVREAENAALGKDTLQELANESIGIETMTDKWLTNIEKVQEKLNGMGIVSKEEAQKVAEEFGITSDNVKADFDSVETRLKEDISRLQKKYDETRDEVEKNKLNIEIARKQQLLDSVQSIGDKVWEIVKNPYTLTIKIKSIWEDTKNFLKGALGKAMPSFWGKGGANAQQQYTAGANIAQTIKQTKNDVKTNATAETKKDEAASKEASEKAKREAQKRAQEAERKAREEAERRRKLADIERKEEERQEKQAQDTEDAIEEARIASIKNNAEREIAEQEYQHKKRLKAIEEQRDQMKKALFDYNKSVWEAKNTDKTKSYEDTEEGKAGWRNLQLSKQQEQQLNAEIEKENAEESRRLEALQENRLQSMRNFLKEYGTLEEQRLAITEEYDLKIREAQSPTEAASLALKRDSEIEKISSEKLMESIDWNGVFNDLSGHSVEFLEGLRDQLQSLLSSGEITDLTQMETIQGKIREINSAINEQGGMFQFANEQQREHIRRLQEAEDAQEALNAAKREEVQASMEVFTATQNLRDFLTSQGIDADVDLDDGLLTQFDENTEEAKKLAEMLARLRKAQADYNKAGEQSKKKLFEWKKAEDAADESLKDSIARVAGNINDWCQQYLGDLPALLDELGLGSAGEKVSQGLSAVNNAAGAAADYASGNYVGAALKAVSAVKDFGRVLGIGGGNAAEVQKTLEELNHRNELLTEAIETLTDAIGNSAGLKAIAAAEEALVRQNEKENNIRGKIDAQMGYHEAHHSFDYYWNGFNDSEIKKVNKTLKIINSEAEEWTGDLSTLTADQAKALLANADLVQKIEETGKGGYGERVLEYIRELAEESGRAEEITRQINDNLTQTSFDSLRSSFLDTLTDMESDSEDFANSFMDMMFKAMVNSQILDDEFDDWLKNWQTEYADAVRNNNTDALEELRRKALDMRDEKLEERNLLAQTMGYDAATREDKSAQTTTADKITYDQADILIGILTAVQIAVEHGNIDRSLVLENINAMTEATRSNGVVVTGIRNLLQTTNEYLYDIKASNEAILDEFGGKIDRIINQLEEL